MAEQPTIVPGAEPKETPITPATPATPAAPADQATVGDLLKGGTKEPAPAAASKPEPKMVPEAALIKVKNDLKALKKSIDAGASEKKISETLSAIGAKYKVDPTFLQELAGALGAVSAQPAAPASPEDADDDEPAEPAKPSKEPAESAKPAVDINKVFKDNFDKTIVAMPEYKDLANEDVIKTLVLDPKNANKTFAQIIEGAYGHLLPGRASIEGSKPRGARDDGQVDMARAVRDTAYFAEIMKDPVKKAAYNKGLSDRVKSSL